MKILVSIALLALSLFGASLAVAAVPSQPVINELSWTDTNSGQSQEDMTIIELSVNGGTFAEVAQVAADVTTYMHTIGADPGGMQYCYRAKARNARGDSTYSNTACKVSPQIIIVVVPNAPSGFNVGQKVGPVVVP